MPKGRDNRTVVGSGSFYKGMVPDVIGARDSMVDIVDGWIDRAGEIRKRGGKTLVTTFVNGGVASAVEAVNTDVRGQNTIAFITEQAAQWHFITNGFPYASVPGTIALATGFDTTAYGNNIFAVGREGSQIFGGDDSGTTGVLAAGIGTVAAGSNVLTGSAGADWNLDLKVGMFINLVNAAAFPLAQFQVVEIPTSTTAILDRAAPAADSGNVLRNSIGSLGSPPAGADSVQAKTCTVKDDRIFIGNTAEQNGGSRIRWSATFTEGDPATNTGSYNYWEEEAFIDVFPGIGGDITALEVIDGQLVIFKQNAVFVLRGDVATKGYDLGARLDKLIETSGVERREHATIFNGGVAWFNEDGIWTYVNNQITNLTDGRVTSYWRSFIKTGVHGVGDRLIVTTPFDTAFIYDGEKDLFYRQTCPTTTAIANYGSSELGAVSPIFVGGDLVITRWDEDFTTNAESDIGPDGVPVDTPRLELITQPLSPAYPFYTDRPNKLLVSGYISDDGGDEPRMDVSILHGRNELDTSGDAPQELEYGFRARGYDNVERIPIPGVPDRPANRFKLTQVNSADDIRIYGIGAEYLGDFTTEADNDTGATSYGT